MPIEVAEELKTQIATALLSARVRRIETALGSAPVAQKHSTGQSLPDSEHPRKRRLSPRGFLLRHTS